MPTRKRRTAEQSRTLILEVAARRLREHGLEGLNITGVAEEAGISHATLLHHFGSSGEMRGALAQKMTLDLLADLKRAFDSRVPVDELTSNVFDALAEGGHARLIAWRAVEEPAADERAGDMSQAFETLIGSVQRNLEMQTETEVKRVVMLVAVAALGYGLAGDVLAQILDMNEDELEGFPTWVSQRLG